MPDKTPRPRRRKPRSIEGGREALERELLWAIALDGDRQRIDVLKRMLTPADNDPTTLTVHVADAGGPAPGLEGKK